MWAEGERRVFAVADADLRVEGGTWAFAEREADAIAVHWARRAKETPRFFNGAVHLLSSYRVSETGQLSARLLRTDFASFLYWRETGWRDPSVMDAFGSALILSPAGRLLLGVQRDGNLNAGLCYPPSGFIDPADIGADGSIDIGASTLREAAEETGLGAAHLTASGGYVVTQAGPVLSIGVLYRTALAEPDLIALARRHIAADPASELRDVLFAAPGATLPERPMPDYARTLLAALPHLKTRG